MEISELVSLLLEFVEGRRPISYWQQFWNEREKEIQQCLSPGEFLRLKPRPGSGTSTIAAFAESLKEMRKILQKHKLIFAESQNNAGLIEQDHNESMKEWSFGGDVHAVSMDELNGSIPEDIIRQLYLDFTRSKSKSQKKWIRETLKGYFRCVDKPPKWIGDPDWPWIDGRPTVFLTQWTAPEILPENCGVIGGEVFYLFAAAVNDRSEIRVVKQFTGVDGKS